MVRAKHTPEGKKENGSLQNYWFANDVAKSYTEKQFIGISIFWIAWFGVIVALRLYEPLQDLGYMLIGLGISLPYIIIPLLFPCKEDTFKPIWDRYWVKANIWVAIFSYVGNYFWTHYFYTVLGASYSFPVQIQLNRVPFFLYLITHGYFAFYFTFSTIVLRSVWSSKIYSSISSGFVKVCFSSAIIIAMSVFTAFMETYTISNVPFYSHKDKFLMYTVGSVFYGIYFYVAFPFFYRIDEYAKDKWTSLRAAIDSLGAAMLVFIMLDIWRLIVANWFPAAGMTDSLPWFL